MGAQVGRAGDVWGEGEGTRVFHTQCPLGSVPSQRIIRKVVLSLLHSVFWKMPSNHGLKAAGKQEAWEILMLRSPSSSDFKILPWDSKNFPNFCLVPTAVQGISSSPPCTGSRAGGALGAPSAEPLQVTRSHPDPFGFEMGFQRHKNVFGASLIEAFPLSVSGYGHGHRKLDMDIENS